MNYLKIKNCRCCGNNKFKNFLNFGKMSLTTQFPKKEKILRKIPMNLIICKKCKLFQLEHNYELKKLYNEDYGYKSGINHSMKKHLSNIVISAMKICNIKRGDVVLDIASNDGTLLKSYKKKIIKKIGIDPTIKKFRKNYNNSNLLGHAGFFNKQSFFKLSRGKKAKIITSIAVFYDLPKPNKFVEDIKNILKDDGIWVLEQSYFPFLLKNVAFDSICHEHLSYFMYKQLKIILDKNELVLKNVSFNSMNGGSFRLFISHKISNFKEDKKNIKKLELLEKKIFDNFNSEIQKFKRKINLAKHNLLNLLAKTKKNSKIVHLYGASTKGNVILQYCKISRNFIPFAAERNSDKYGRFTPGSSIPIISEKESRKLNPDYYLVMPWHFKDEILERENEYLQNGGKLIFPLPKIKIYEK